jgi:uncharacterized membrane protein
LTAPSWRAGARFALALGYPVAIYCALLWFEPRWVAAAVVALILLRWRGRALAMFAGLSWLSHAVIAGSLLLAVGALVANDETLLRLYPAGASLAMLAVFALSLHSPPTIAERFARLRRPELPEDAVRYTRHVTVAWCAFFTINAAIMVVSGVLGLLLLWPNTERARLTASAVQPKFA